MASDPARYRFGPIEPAGAIGGLGWNQLACVAIGLVGLVVSLNVAPSTGGALVGLAIAGCGLASAFLSPRPAARRSRGRRSPAATPRAAPGAVTSTTRAPPLAGTARVAASSWSICPRALAACRSSRPPPRGVRSGSPATAPPGRPCSPSRGAPSPCWSWTTRSAGSRAGAGCCRASPGPAARSAGSPGSTAPSASPLTSSGATCATACACPPPTRGCAPTSSCSTRQGPPARQHETFIALQIDARGLRRAIRRAGGRDEGAVAVLLRELAALAEHLQRAEVVVRGALSPRLLARAIRLGFCPDDRPGLDRLGAGDPERAGTAPANAGPMAAEESWRHYRTDGAFHCTYWIAEWPRIEVGADFLLPFVLAGTTRRTIARGDGAARSRPRPSLGRERPHQRDLRRRSARPHGVSGDRAPRPPAAGAPASASTSWRPGTRACASRAT